MFRLGMYSIYFVVLLGLSNHVNSKTASPIVRIYSTTAEFIRPLEKLPLQFSEEEWKSIRADSITLLDHNLTVNLQTITEKKGERPEARVYVRSPVAVNGTAAKLVKGLLVDDATNLVKIQDRSIADRHAIYFTVPADQIYHLEQPVRARSKYYVDFKYTPSHSEVFVSYLQSNLHWRTHYQLNLHEQQSELIAVANIRNDHSEAIDIERAELIAGDINLHTQQQDDRFRRSTYGDAVAAQSAPITLSDSPQKTTPPVVEQARELVGTYVFPISKPFKIEGKTNYLLPMFRPRVSIERFCSISKLFSAVTVLGKAQRSYRLESDRFLSAGNAIVREDDRIIGETLLPNIAANDRYQFSLGYDADVVYRERVTLMSTRTYNESVTVNRTELYKQLAPGVSPTYAFKATTPVNGTKEQKDVLPTATVAHKEYIYKIDLELKNFKDRAVHIEYEQKVNSFYQKFILTASRSLHLTEVGTSIKSNITLKANQTGNLSYNLLFVD